MLPKDIPSWQNVYRWLRRFVRLMLFHTIHDIALMMDRERAGRQASPSAGVVDGQTVKAPAPGAATTPPIQKRWLRIKHLFADGAYDRTQLMDKAAFLDFVIKVARRIDTEPDFKVLPRRWVVERTFGWLTRWRGLVRDCEKRFDVSEAMIDVAMSSLLLRRLCH